VLIRNSPTISPPVKRKVFLKSFTHSSLGSGWCAASQPWKPPWLSRSRSRVRALSTAASTLSRLRMMPASASSRCTSRAPNRATTTGSKPRYAAWNAARFLRMVSQESPAWLISRMSRSNSSASVVSGKPYSPS
jgi:hypothetical protein